MCGSTLFHVLRKQNISLYAFVSSNAVLVKKKDKEFLQFFVLFLLVGILIFILLYRRSPSRVIFVTVLDYNAGIYILMPQAISFYATGNPIFMPQAISAQR